MKYKIGQRVWHITGEGSGIITEAIYTYTTKKWSYIVTLGFGECVNVSEDEISSSVKFN
ncbi:MAG: hypothetical protein GX323_02140 [Clostridiales bacterium]|nr:hypothetical protein [Clostridiales bacterium]